MVDRAVQLKPLVDAFLQQASGQAYSLEQTLSDLSKLAQLWRAGIPVPV